MAQILPAPPTQTFEYSSQPQALGMKRSKYRSADEDALAQSNIMHDRRVVRGNTYGAQVP